MNSQDIKEILERLELRAVAERKAAGNVQGPAFRGTEWGADIIEAHRQHAADLLSVTQALRAYLSGSEPLPVSMEGWRLVPAIPSEEMLSAGCDQFRRSREAGNGFCYALGPAYRAMISAAPAPPLEKPA